MAQMDFPHIGDRNRLRADSRIAYAPVLPLPIVTRAGPVRGPDGSASKSGVARGNWLLSRAIARSPGNRRYAGPVMPAPW